LSHNFQVDSLTVHRHADIQAAKLIAQTLGRHFGIPYHKFPDAVRINSEQFRDEPFQQVGVSHEQHFKQRVILERVFQFRHYAHSSALSVLAYLRADYNGEIERIRGNEDILKIFTSFETG
jgi:hypothetical protein